MHAKHRIPARTISLTLQKREFWRNMLPWQKVLHPLRRASLQKWPLKKPAKGCYLSCMEAKWMIWKLQGYRSCFQGTIFLMRSENGRDPQKATLVPVQMSEPAAPAQLLWNIRYNCGGRCYAWSYTCFKNGLQCTPACTHCKGIVCQVSTTGSWWFWCCCWWWNMRQMTLKTTIATWT